MTSGTIGSKFQHQLEPETNMESFLDDHAFLDLEYCFTSIISPNLTGFRCLTDISQTQNRRGKSKGNEQLNLNHLVNSHVASIENSLFSSAKLTNLHGINGGKKTQYTDHIEPLRSISPCEDFKEIASDDDVARDPDVVFRVELTQNDRELIGDVLLKQTNYPPSPILTEDMIVADFVAAGNQKPTQENYLFNDLQLDVTQDFIVVDKTDTILNQLNLENAEVLCFIPDQSQEPILVDSLQYEGCQIPSTVVEVINGCKSQPILQTKPNENTLPILWQEQPARRGRGRPRKDSSQTQSRMVEAQPVFDPQPSISGERRSKLVCKNNLKSIVNEINIDQPEEHEYSQAAGRKRKLSTSSMASTSSSSSQENRNPNNSNNIASKKSRDKKKEQERQTQIELEQQEKKNEELKQQLEKINWALNQVQAVVMPGFSPKQ